MGQRDYQGDIAGALGCLQGTTPASPRGVSLLVEGGGVRGFFAAGVLKCLVDEGVRLPYVVGVSSGALNAVRYAAGKPEVDVEAICAAAKPFLNPASLVRPELGVFRTGPLLDAILDGCWERLVTGGCELRVPATDAETGELVWWGNEDFVGGPERLKDRVAASASIPFLMPVARVDGREYADGGIRDSIPIDRAEADGFRRHVLILSRPRGYVKGRQHLELYLRKVLAPYPKLKVAMLARHIRYNESARRAERLEDEGRAFVFRMSETRVGRFELSPEKMGLAYEDGYALAKERMADLRRWLAQGEPGGDDVTRA